MNCADDYFNMGMFYKLKVSFKTGLFSDTTHTRPDILYWNPHPSAPLKLTQTVNTWMLIGLKWGVHAYVPYTCSTGSLKVSAYNTW